ncbi:hypothetical protein BH09PSE2_BH09PSE2_22320 [soil metagenome]
MTPFRRTLMTIACATAGLAAASSAGAESVLFVGNSFTFGAYSPVWKYRAASVTDLNAGGVGGVPALFKLFASEVGLDYQVSLVTNPGIGLDYHWANNLAKIDRAWDHVLLQSFSTLDRDKPGDPGLLTDYTARFTKVLKARNPAVDIELTATWSRPDMTYAGAGPWRGKPITQMADDLQRGYVAAARATPGVRGVVAVGEAFNAAVRPGVADADPYDGIDFGKVDLWAYDHYHASAFGYYLEALMIFGALTGKDPQSLGARETAAVELGFSAQQTQALQKVAHDQLSATPPGRLPGG